MNSTDECFKYQLDLLKEEIQSIERVIDRMDGITQTTKNWGIVTWTASVGVILGQPKLHDFLIVTAVLPLVFWIIDGIWRRLQKRSVYRLRRISHFINEGDLLKSFEERRLIGFRVLDPIGSTHREEGEYRQYVSLRRTLFFHEVWLIYWSLAGISVALGLLLRLTSWGGP